jgi:hypothetical protein
LAAGPLDSLVAELPLLEEPLPEELLLELPLLELLLLLALPLLLPPASDPAVNALLALELEELASVAELEPEPPHAASVPSSAYKQQRTSVVPSIGIFP